ncbi:MAG: hypothetical protein Nk1A_7240 [Endomicrobiia bacterium]|nr:MAG: hypothetical protein Nk1A_7240 [Endomicrobiia bacterium]
MKKVILIGLMLTFFFGGQVFGLSKPADKPHNGGSKIKLIGGWDGGGKLRGGWASTRRLRG